MIQIRSSNATTGIGSNEDVTSTPIESHTHVGNEKNATFQMLQDEFELITNAIYTEPDDQTAWWYQVFLFHYLTTNVLRRIDDSAEQLLVTKYKERIIQPHLQQVRELLNETNHSSKWVLIGLLQCLQFVKNHQTAAASVEDTFDINEINQERRTILQTLIQIDPDRKERYKYKLHQIH